MANPNQQTKRIILMGRLMKGYFYRLIMRIAHKYHWHYAPPIYPEGDTQLWCKWCGFRQTIRRAETKRQAAEVCVNHQQRGN